MSDVPELRALKRLRVAELRALLESRDVDSSGTKDALVNRLDACRAPVAPEDEDAPAPKKTKPAAPDAPSLASPSPPAPDARADPPTSKSPHAARLYVGFLGDNCDGDFVARLFAPHFTPASIHVPTSRRGDANVPRGFAFVDPPPDASPDAVASAVAALRESIRCPGAPRALVVAPARAPPPTVPTPRRFIFTRRPRDLLLPCASIRISVGASSSTDLPRTSRRRRRRACFERTGRFEASESSTRARGKTTYRDAPRWSSRRETRQRRRRARSRAPPRSSEVDPFASRGTASRARGIGNRNRIKSRGRGDEDGRSSRGRGRGSGRDKGRERGRGRGEGNARGGGGGGGGEGGYVGVHLAGLPPSASVSIAHAHLYRR